MPLKALHALSPETLAGRRVLVRADLNVPLQDGRVTDDFRLRELVPTLEWLRQAEAVTIVASHLGDKKASLLPVVRALEKYIRVGFLPWAHRAETAAMPGGSITVLENLRAQAGEEANEPAFAQALASLGELYVNEAFSASHRAHASIVGVPKLLPSVAGPRFVAEVEHLERLFAAEPPLVVVIGGAKFGTKLPLVEKFLPRAAQICVGGALAHSFFKARGYELGESLIDADVKIDHLAGASKIIVPADVRLADGRVVAPSALGPGDKIVDVGPATLAAWSRLIASAKTILWNGPLGNYENGHTAATLELARVISTSSAYSVVGGGDTLAAISALGLGDKFGFVSTAGGAMLDFLATGTLPGIEALTKSPR